MEACEPNERLKLDNRMSGRTLLFAVDKGSSVDTSEEGFGS
jgi:hypothetical protein